jgi:hypothetical protein
MRLVWRGGGWLLPPPTWAWGAATKTPPPHLLSYLFLKDHRGFMAFEKITQPSFPGRGSDRVSLARLFKAGTLSSLSTVAAATKTTMRPGARL